MTHVQTLEAPLSCQWTQLTYNPDMGPRRKPRASSLAHTG